MDTMEAQRRSRSVSSTPQKPRLPDYERCFLAFELPTHSIMALSNRFSRDKDGRAYVEAKIDEGLEVEVEPSNAAVVRKTAFNSCELLHIFPHYRHLHLPLVISVKSLVGQIRGTPQNLIDRKESQFANATQKPMELLKMVPVKSLKFAEDVRPPYVGTYTRLQDGLSISQLARNPFSRTLPETNYDYDSEAEWEEPGEGEDLDSEGEEELGDDEDEAEMDGFLDDEEAIDARRIKRRPLLGDLEPTCTGLCWEGPKTPTAKNGAFALDLLMFKLDILMGKHSFTAILE